MGPAGSAWSCLGSVMCWKLSCLLSMEFFPCKKNPCSALPCSAAALGLSSQCCESVLPRGSAELCGDSSPSEWERSVENFPGSTPVLPCCEPDLSLPLHPSEGGWFGSLGMDPGQSSSRLQLSQGSSSRVQGAKRSVAAVPLPWPRPFSPPTWCCFSAPSQGMDGLLALTIPAGAAKISDLVQEELVPPSHGAHLGPSSALPSPGSSWKGQGWGGPAPGSSCSLSFGAGAERCGKLLAVGTRLSRPPPPALGSQGATRLVPEHQEDKGGFEGRCFCSFL